MPVAQGSIRSLPRVLRPGVLIPAVGYTFMFGSGIAAVVLAVVAPEGGGHRFPAAGDWSALSSRMIASIVCACAAWAFYKVASNKAVLHDESMEIVTFMLRWTVARDEVADVRVVPSSLEIRLADGCAIRPSMFWTTPAGAVYSAAGLFKNAMSRSTIRKQILTWRQAPTPVLANGSRFWPCRRHWRFRLNLGFLGLAVAVVAIESMLVTAFA